MERPLSPSERAMWLLDQAAALNGVLVAHVDGPLSAGVLRPALDLLQARHPLLRARVEGGPGPGARFVVRRPTPVPLREAAREGERTWLAVAEEELNRRFLPDGCPLLRAVLVPRAGGAEVVLAYHHVIADAMTAIYQAEELLGLCGLLAEGKDPEAAPPLPLRPPLGDLMPAEARGWRRLRAMNAYLWHEGWTRAVRRPRKLRPAARAAPAERRTRILPHRLSARETAQLLARCRQERTTVQGLLCAALLLSAAEDLGLGRSAWVGCFSGVNLRDALQPPVGREAGVYVSQASTYHRLRTGVDLFSLAREARARLQACMARGEPYVSIPLLGLFIPRGPDPAPRLWRRLDQAAAATVGITNVGRLETPARYGPLRLGRLHFAIGAALIAPVVLGACTFQGALAWNFLYVEPQIEEARARRMAARIGELIALAARPETAARPDSAAPPSAGCGRDPPPSA